MVLLAMSCGHITISGLADAGAGDATAGQITLTAGRTASPSGLTLHDDR